MHSSYEYFMLGLNMGLRGLGATAFVLGVGGKAFAPTAPPPEPVNTGAGVATIVPFDNLTAVADIVAYESGVFRVEGAKQVLLVTLEKGDHVQTTEPLTRTPLEEGQRIEYRIFGPDGGYIGGGTVFGPDTRNPLPVS